MHKKGGTKREISTAVIIILIAIIFLCIIIFKEPAITGRVVEGKESIFSENLNLQINESGTYEWQVKNPGSIKSLKATGSVNPNGTARVYVEKDGKRLLLFDSAKQLFDVAIHVLPEYKKVLQGEKILIENNLFNLRGFGAGDVAVRYSIKDSDGNIIAVEEETVFIETRAKFVRELVMPAEVKQGTYIAFVEAFANGTIVGTGSDTFEVEAEYEIPIYQQLKYYIIGFAVLIAMVIIGALAIYEFEKLKKKQKIAELKEKMPLERIEKLEKELKALEEAKNAGFISEESFQREKKRIEEKLGVSKKEQ